MSVVATAPITSSVLHNAHPVVENGTHPHPKKQVLRKRIYMDIPPRQNPPPRKQRYLRYTRDVLLCGKQGSRQSDAHGELHDFPLVGEPAGLEARQKQPTRTRDKHDEEKGK